MLKEIDKLFDHDIISLTMKNYSSSKANQCLSNEIFSKTSLVFGASS